MEKSPAFDFEAYERQQYLGKTWQYVLEENEWFDGEKEIEAAAKERWRENQPAGHQGPAPRSYASAA